MGTVFPTCVGVFLVICSLSRIGPSLPHVRGGVSKSLDLIESTGQSSPRAWGCFQVPVPRCPEGLVFPTCVGVFLNNSYTPQAQKRLPHVRGGVSRLRPRRPECPTSSPRAWGCFPLRGADAIVDHVFPTCVGVFPAHRGQRRGHSRLPHVRGGVSALRGVMRRILTSSPRAWGCFPAGEGLRRHPEVFPTCVGVFPLTQVHLSGRRGLPHVRGGVSLCGCVDLRTESSSPRAWGCFFSDCTDSNPFYVFPTCVGVFQCSSSPRQTR